MQRPLSSLPLVVIAGPTATGKTAIGVELAHRYNGELIGADSIQVYTGFDIGSAKPTSEELRGIPHHLLDVTTADKPLDAVDYAHLADTAISDVIQRGKLPIVVGGTGLWIRALLRGLIVTPKIYPHVRARLEQKTASLDAEALHATLHEVDPLAAQHIHPNDRVRIIRALEVYEQTGVPLGQLRKTHALGEPRYDSLNLVLDLDRPTLYARIRQRTKDMLSRGWVQECQQLLARYGSHARPLTSVGYRQLIEHLSMNQPLDITERHIAKATQVYTRRQRTWFRGEPGFAWWTSAQTLLEKEACQKIDAYLRHRGML